VEFDSEVERRREAVRLVDNGVSVAETARRVGRSRWWVHQWLNRYRAEGDDGLMDQSRARKTQLAQTPPVTVAKILKIRRDFEDNPAASIGALSILAKMERDRWPDIPSIATIERILSSAGVTRHKQRERRSGETPANGVRGETPAPADNDPGRVAASRLDPGPVSHRRYPIPITPDRRCRVPRHRVRPVPRPHDPHRGHIPPRTGMAETVDTPSNDSR